MNSLLLSVVLGLFAPAGESLPTPTEKLSAEQAARLYRISVYETFRGERPEFNRRRELGDKVWNRFEALGRPQDQYHEVLDWFSAARQATLASPAGELPPLPEFTTLPPVANNAHDVIPVATSAPEERVRINLPPVGAATRLDVTLPREAVQTGPTRFFSSLVRGAVHAATGLDEQPTITTTSTKLPKTSATALPEASPLEITLPPQAVSTQPTAAEQQPKLQPVKPELNIDFDELFSPATTPVDKKPATDADPFAP